MTDIYQHESLDPETGEILTKQVTKKKKEEKEPKPAKAEVETKEK